MRRSHRFFPGAGGALRHGLSAVALALLASCGSPALVRLHSLMPGDVAPAAETGARPQPDALLAIVLDPIRMPSQVDQPQWLVQLPDGSLASLEQERWASPLRDEFRQAVLETLIVRYNAVELRHLAGAASNASALRVDIDVRRFESLPGQEARIEGSWTIKAASSSAMPAPAAAHCEWLIRERSGAALATLAQAHRRAVSRLSDGIGAAMLAMKRSEAPTCAARDGSG